MQIQGHHRADDPISDDDIVLRAGGGAVEALVEGALRNAPLYEDLWRTRLCPTPWALSVHVPRLGRASKEQLLAVPPYSRYIPSLEAEAATLLELPFVEIVATTIVMPGVASSPVDRCHYDVVIDADDEQQLAACVGVVRKRFTRHVNPTH